MDALINIEALAEIATCDLPTYLDVSKTELNKAFRHWEAECNVHKDWPFWGNGWKLGSPRGYRECIGNAIRAKTGRHYLSTYQFMLDARKRRARKRLLKSMTDTKLLHQVAWYRFTPSLAGRQLMGTASRGMEALWNTTKNWPKKNSSWVALVIADVRRRLRTP